MGGDTKGTQWPMPFFADSLWDALQPCLDALVRANARAGLRVVMPPHIRADEQEGEIGQFLFRLGEPDGALQVLPIEGKYWDGDNHAVFLVGFRDAKDYLREVELSRL